ncbi:reverse transcriptase domain-containing protein [Tanacetum coccineum]
MTPRAVLMKSSPKSFNTARPVNTVRSVNTARPFSTARFIYDARPIYTAQPKPTVNCARPVSCFSNQAQTTVKRPFYKKTVLTNMYYNQKFNTVRRRVVNTARPFVNTVKANRFNAVKPSACWVWRPIKPNGVSLGNPQLNDKGFVDSGCSRHMTGMTWSQHNMAAFLEKSTGSEGTAEATTSDNGEVMITATIDGHSKFITEASLRRHLKLEDHDEQHIPTPHDSPLHAVYSHGSDEGSLKLNELTNLVTKLSDRIGVLEDDLKKTKQTYSSAFTKLILRVKKLETIVKTGKARKRARVVLSEDDEHVEDDSSKQGRKLSNAVEWFQDDAEVQDKASNEIEPVIQEVTPTEVIHDQGSSEKGQSEVSIAGATQGTASEVLIVSTAEVNISTASEIRSTTGRIVYNRRSEETRRSSEETRKDKGKAIMTEPEPKKKSKKELEQERLSIAEAIRLQEQIDEDQRAQIARDEEITRQWEEQEKQKAMSEAKSSKKIDWNDPFVLSGYKEGCSEELRPERRNKLRAIPTPPLTFRQTSVESPNLEKPNNNQETFNPPIVTMDDNRTMAQLLEAPTEGYEDAIVVPEINANNFEIKHGLLNLVQNKQFFGHDKEDPHAHIRYFNKITSTMKFPNVPSTSVKLMLFPFSLEGAARIWLDKEPPRSILTWDDLVSKFINKFFPPSKTTNLRNEITRFQQRFDESFYEAWDRFNDLLRACPHHGFSAKDL